MNSTNVLKGQMSPRRKLEIAWGFAFVGPVILGILVFMGFPTLYGFFISTFKWSIIGKNPEFIGLGNFLKLINDPQFLKALKNTTVYVVGILLFSVPLSLLLAALFNRKLPFGEILKITYYLPVITMMVAVSMVWRWVLSTEYGILNYFLGLVGIPNIAWLNDPKWAMPGIIIMSIWKGVGFNMVLFIAGLKNIPAMYYEAAEIDGASSLRQFLKITLPLLSPTTLFIFLTTMMNSFQIFEQAMILFSGATEESTGAGPDNAANTIVLYLYNNAFKWGSAGYAAAQAIVLFVILIVITSVQMKLQKRWVHYDA